MSERELGPHRIPKQMVDSIPGPILLPAKFVLSADQEDLADWDEPDTPWIEDTSYWLYIFCQEQTAHRDHTEFKLLALLAQRCGRVQSREQLLRDVWEYNSLIDTRTVDTHMRRLRDKLGAAAKHLDTVRGVGYRFVEAAP